MSLRVWGRTALFALLLAAGEAIIFGLSGWSPAGKVAAGSLLLVLFLLATYAAVASYSRRLHELTRAASRLAEGDSSVRVRARDTQELTDIARSLNTVAGALHTRTSLYAAEQEQAGEILAVMRDGVLVLDDTGRIVRANAAASRLLDAPLQESVGRRVVDVVRTFPALELVAKALTSDEPLLEKVEAPGPRYLSIDLIALREPHPLPRGDSTFADASSPPSGHRGRQVLLILHDETTRVMTARMRRDFAANVSHELKTPLAGLKLLADTLQHAVVEEPEQAVRFAQRLSSEIGRLSDLVTDLLTLASLERSKAAPPPGAAPVDLARVAASVAAEEVERCRTKRLTLTLDLPAPAPVLGDELQLATLVRNLLDNAIRFTDEGGAIQLRVTTEMAPGMVALQVIDNGIGIPKNEQTRIFERFYRVDKARSRETGGTGLGLSIVKHIVEQHQGTITVESTLGLGSTFTALLPLYRDDTPPAPTP